MRSHFHTRNIFFSASRYESDMEHHIFRPMSFKQFHIRPLFIVRNMFLPNPSIATAMPYSRRPGVTLFSRLATIKTCFVHIPLLSAPSHIYFDFFFSFSCFACRKQENSPSSYNRLKVEKLISETRRKKK